MHPSPTGDLTTGANMTASQDGSTRVESLDLHMIEDRRGRISVIGLFSIVQTLRDAGDIEAGDALLDAVERAVAIATEMLHRFCQHDTWRAPCVEHDVNYRPGEAPAAAPAVPMLATDTVPIKDDVDDVLRRWHARSPLASVTVCCPECGYATTVRMGDPMPVGGLWCQSCGEFLRARVG